MKYPKYNSTNIRKNGIKRGKQNHICYDCRRQFVIHNEKPPVLGDHSAETFRPLWALVSTWKSYFYVTDGWPNKSLVPLVYKLQSHEPARSL